MKEYKVTLKSLSPYMQDRMDDVSLKQWEKQRGPIHERAGIDDSDNIKAEFRCYRNKEGQCYIPSDQIKGGNRNKGKSRYKIKINEANSCGLFSRIPSGDNCTRF